MANLDIKSIPHSELLQAYTRGDRVFGMILPYNSLPPMSLDVVRVEIDSVVVRHWTQLFRVKANDPRFAFWSVRFADVCEEYRRAGWGYFFDVLDDPQQDNCMGIASCAPTKPINPLKIKFPYIPEP